MRLAMIGLGRMGANMAERLARGGHEVVGYDLDETARQRAHTKGIAPVASLADAARALTPRRVFWLMVPAGRAVDDTLAQLEPLVTRADVVVDGGNSNYRDSERRSETMRSKGVSFVDVGTSGGIWGLEEGYSLMIGGDRDVVDWLTPVFKTLAPAADRGWGYVGPSGAGHFVKMVHNGIEYGLMEAYAEGFAILHAKRELSLDLHQIAEIWRAGSVVRSWLLDLTASALAKDPDLERVKPYVADSGEGRWTVAEAIEQGVSTPVIALSLLRRLRSRETEPFADRLLATLRHEFGGHEVKKEA